MPVIIADDIVQNQVNTSADVTAKKAADLALATIHLFTNNIPPTPQNVTADFIEAAFTGYAAQAVAGWGANELSLDGGVATNNTTVLEWIGPADASGQTIYGYYILSAGGGTPLIGAYLFANPVSLNVPTDVLDLVVAYKRHP